MTLKIYNSNKTSKQKFRYWALSTVKQTPLEDGQFQERNIVALGQPGSLASIRLYVWQRHQNVFCTTELCACLVLYCKSGVLSECGWISESHHWLGFARGRIILEHTALAPQTARVLGCCLLCAHHPQGRDTASPFIWIKLPPSSLCSRTLELGKWVHIPPANSHTSPLLL